MRGTRGGLVALIGALAALALVSGREGASATPRALVLEPIAGAYNFPVFATSPPGDTDRLLVVQQGTANVAQVKLVLGGIAQPTPFLTISNVMTGGERGLLSMAFAPDYATSRKFYIYYTRTPDGAIQIDEFLRDPNDPNIADPTTRRAVLTVPHPGQSNHNGGQLQFGPDNLLYIGTGDGGGAGDQPNNAQNLNVGLGKLLRIDPRQNGANPYTVPANNPFVGQPPRLPEIWSYGLRNPWRFSFDRVTGALNIADVGQGAYEEIDYRPIDVGWGRWTNFGWRCREGRHPYNSNCSPPYPDLVLDPERAGDRVM